MIEKFLEILGNSHFEAWVGGGLMGVIYGQLFNVFGKSNDQNLTIGSGKSPQDMQHQMRVQQSLFNSHEVHHHHYHGRSSSGHHDDASSFLIISAVVLSVVLLVFAAYLPQITEALYFSIVTISVFSLTAAISSGLGGRYNSIEWWLHTIFPALTSAGCFYVVSVAHQSISADVVRYAHSLISNQPLTISTIISSAITFLRTINNEYARWMIFEMLAFIFITISTIVSAMQCVYYIALINFRDSGSDLWRSIATLTARFRGVGSLIFSLSFLLGAWYLATGQVYRMTLQWGN
jgi:hypothetical protein